MRNLVPLPYRRVSYQVADFPLTDDGLRTIIGREAYRHTDYVVYRAPAGADGRPSAVGGALAVAAVEKHSREPLFSPITSARWLSPPGRTRLVVDGDVDTGIPTAMLGKALALGLEPDETLVVVGRYEHVNFIAHPEPVVVTVVEVAPPEPPKLWDQVQRVLAVAPLGAAVPRLERIDLRDLALSSPPGPDGYLFPCRASGFDRLGVPAHFLDERPPRGDWRLIGCERSLQIHEHHYGDRPPSTDICPRKLAGPRDTRTILKCCLLERGIQREGAVVVVPWGATLQEVEEALRELVGSA
jgi:hypothetical protein